MYEKYSYTAVLVLDLLSNESMSSETDASLDAAHAVLKSPPPIMVTSPPRMGSSLSPTPKPVSVRPRYQDS